MQRILLVFLISIFTCYFSYAQDEKWQVYLSYRDALKVEAADNSVYCLTRGSSTVNTVSGNLVRCDLEDGSIKCYNSLSELSAKEILHISYNKVSQRLLIIYENGNIDLLDQDGNIYNIPALMHRSILGASVSGIYHIDEVSYLCINNLLIKIDTNEAIILDSYKSFDGVIYSMAHIMDYMYFATSKGLFKILNTSNLHDKSIWSSPINSDIYKEIVVHDSLLFGRKDNGIDEIQLNGLSLNIIPNKITFLEVVDNKLLFGMSSYIYIYEGEYTSRWKNIQFRHTSVINDITCINDNFYIAEGVRGLNCYKHIDKTFTNGLSIFDIDSPIRDRFYHMQYVGDRLLVAGGINTQSASYYPVTFMYMETVDGNPKWTIFDEQTPQNEYPSLSHYNAVDLVQDPFDSNHFWGAVYRNGLHEYRRNEYGKIEFIKLYNYENSPLRCIDVKTSSPWNYCTCTALQYDKNGNLWMANQQTDTIVRVLRPNGKWLSLYYPEIVEASNVFQYLFSSYGINFMVSLEGSGKGFFGFDINGTINAVEDDRHLLRYSITNQDGTTVLPTHFYCMTEDKDRQIWCGTNEGLFVITRPEDWFKSDFRFHQIKRNRNDGSGFADYLLAGVDITCITVDASNRKWIGTQSDGVYLVSHDGQETIHHFTTDNSPLLSNHIQSIAINPRTGRVMLGTDRGLCSYDEQVTEAENILTESTVRVYPNPVRPNTNAIVTIDGLTDGAEVKILTSSGQVVWGTNSVGGSVRWNCCNTHGQRVPSGVYHVVCNTVDVNQTVVGRIVVLR